MNVRGPCSGCGAQLAARPALLRRVRRAGGPAAGDALPPAATPAEAAAGGWTSSALPMPIQMATTFAALALGFGVVVGTAISPNLAGTIAGPTVVAQAPPPLSRRLPRRPPAAGGAGSRSGAHVELSCSSFPEETPAAGGGKKKKKKKKEKKDYREGIVVRANPNAEQLHDRRERLAASRSTSTAGARSRSRVTTVRVPVEELANGTFGEDGKRKDQAERRRPPRFIGIVTFTEPARTAPADPGPDYVDRDPADDLYAVSSRGASLLVHAPDPNPTNTPDTEPPPALGSIVTVAVEIVDPPAATAPPPGYPAPRDPFCSRRIRARFPRPRLPRRRSCARAPSTWSRRRRSPRFRASSRRSARGPASCCCRPTTCASRSRTCSP